MNHTTIQYIQDNYNLILKNLRNLSSRENIEDAISELYIKLIKREYNIENPEAFIAISISNYNLSLQRKTRNVVNFELNDMGEDIEAPSIIDYINDEQEQNNRLRLMKEKIQELPLKQKEALENYFKYGKTSLAPGNPNTNKMNFRWAMLALKDRLGFGLE